MQKVIRIVSFSLVNDELEFTDNIGEDVRRAFRGIKENIFSSRRGQDISHRDVQREFIKHAERYMVTWESGNVDAFQVIHSIPANRPDPQSEGNIQPG